MAIDTTNYGTITGYLGTVVGDTPFDVNDNPDNLPAIGYVTFTPNVKWIQNTNLGVLLPQKVTSNLINGFLSSPDGNAAKLFVKLFPTDDPLSNPINWTYSVNIVLTGLGAASIPVFDISVPSGAVIDLKNVIPAASSPGVSVATAVGLANQAAVSAAAAAASAASAATGGTGGTGLTTGAVLDIHVNAAAAVQLSKTVDSTGTTGRLAMTNAERNKLGGIAVGAGVSQLASTISDFAAAALAAGGGGGGTALVADSVLDVHVNTAAGVQLSKTADSTTGAGRLALTNVERTKLAGIPAGTGVSQLSTTISDFATAAGAITTTQINALIGTSPTLMNTLQEIDAALNNDPNYATTMTSALALKAPLASPALTGTPTAPTPVSGTGIANKTYVDGAIAGINANTTGLFGAVFPTTGLVDGLAFDYAP